MHKPFKIFSTSHNKKNLLLTCRMFSMKSGYECGQSDRPISTNKWTSLFRKNAASMEQFVTRYSNTNLFNSSLSSTKIVGQERTITCYKKQSKNNNLCSCCMRWRVKICNNIRMLKFTCQCIIFLSVNLIIILCCIVFAQYNKLTVTSIWLLLEIFILSILK